MTNMSLHFMGVGSHSRLFEALGAMLSRSALNPADISIVSSSYWYSWSQASHTFCKEGEEPGNEANFLHVGVGSGLLRFTTHVASVPGSHPAFPYCKRRKAG